MKFLDICCQIEIVYTVYLASQDEKEWQLGADPFTASLEQSAIVHVALKQIEICFECLGWKFLSGKTWTALTLSPILVGAATTYAPIESTEWQERVSAISFQLGNVGRVLVVAATVALSILGQNSRVAIALGTYGICYLKDLDDTPDEVKETIHLAAYLLSIAAGLYEEGYIDRFFNGLNLIGFTEHYFGPYLYGQYEETNLADAAEMTYEEFLTIDSEQFVINPAHFKEKPSLYGKVPESYETFAMDMDRWVAAFEKINWEEHSDWILHKLSVDDQWISPQYVESDVRILYQEYLVEQRTKEEIAPFAIDYFKEGVRILAHRLKRRAAQLARVQVQLPEVELKVRRTYSSDIGSVSKAGFENMQRLIAPITAFIEENPRSEKSIGTLIQLGIDGANFCGTRLSDLFDILAKDLFEETFDAAAIANTILREKQMGYLHDLMERETGKYPEFFRRLLGYQTPHRRNMYLEFYGKPIGLGISRTENDETIPNYSEGSRLFWIWWVRRAKREFYTEHYTRENVIEWVREQAQSHHRLSWEKMQIWFNDHGVKDSQACDTESGKYNEEALRFFLVKLGALAPRA